MKKSIVVANWKMNMGISDAHVLATEVRNGLSGIGSVEVVLCPPSIWLSEVKQIIGNKKISLGAQNMFYEPEGAYTGEISPTMIKEVADYVIIGHSERREYFGETDHDVNEKTISALRAGLIPIICVGERKEKNNIVEPVKELREALEGIPKKHFKDIIIAYEPVWAIGTGENAEAEYVAKVCNKLREFVDAETAIIYGGSVKSSNVLEYAKRPEIDGLLVGGASLRASEFIKLCKDWSDARSLK
ncbi:MAG: triose-phosphate isomerase [Candidatus Berkelbacteria bacterium]